MLGESIGRYIRTLEEKCGECNVLLQERGKKTESVDEGVVIEIEISYRYCYVCGEESQFDSKTNDWRKNNERNKKRIGLAENARRTARRSSGRGGRRDS